MFEHNQASGQSDAEIELELDALGDEGFDVGGFLGLILAGHLHQNLETSVNLGICKWNILIFPS